MNTLSSADRLRTSGPSDHAFCDALLPKQLLMDRLVELLIQKAKVGLHWPDLYDRTEAMLGQLWLPIADNRVAKRRLSNAREYAEASDYRAAAYELRLVRTTLAI